MQATTVEVSKIICSNVRVEFEDQKNGEKNEPRTQRRSGDPSLSPVVHFVRAVQRVRKYVPGVNEKTPLCAVNIRGYKSKFITQAFTLELLKDTCEMWGGEDIFGFGKGDIGNKSIRSGAAMALFL